MKGLALVLLAVLLGLGGGLWCASVTGCGPHLSPAQQADVDHHVETLSGCLAEGRAAAAMLDGGQAEKVDAGEQAYAACKREAGIQ